jgi:hypothetical protein
MQATAITGQKVCCTICTAAAGADTLALCKPTRHCCMTNVAVALQHTVKPGARLRQGTETDTTYPSFGSKPLPASGASLRPMGQGQSSTRPGRTCPLLNHAGCTDNKPSTHHAVTLLITKKCHIATTPGGATGHDNRTCLAEAHTHVAQQQHPLPSLPPNTSKVAWLAIRRNPLLQAECGMQLAHMHALIHRQTR